MEDIIPQNRTLESEVQNNPNSPQKAALGARDVAALLGVSARHVWSLHAQGGIPRPIRLGRCVRWRRRELLTWLDAGCPPRDRWEELRASSR